MGLLSRILRSASGDQLLWRCPGCNRPHAVRYGPGGWTWEGGAERPTFNPSVLVKYDGADAGRDGAPPAVCHSFVREGRMIFLADCTHALAGQTVPIPPWETDPQPG